MTENQPHDPSQPEEPTLGLPGLAPASAAGQPSPYRVLARKYRPQTFDDLIGQEAMVRTLSNAFASGRIPQAWMLTGVRGVGKTTTARILARGLNYELAEGDGGGKNAGPTIAMPKLGLHCQSIIESRHVDVIEMDAASHTGVEDVRQITDGIRYAPASARYKVYIIDEVHMLSEKAFNAFLKTLEEPPPHAKFVFATTEIRKVPITILSRCQRFDLRRVDADVLARHLSRICANEGVTIEDEALAIIARAAEGSVRDSLSILDQAIAHADAGGGNHAVQAAELRLMLGLADRSRVIDLFETLMRGDLAQALGIMHDLWQGGGDPVVILTDLAEFTHFVTRLKIVPASADDASVTQVERVRGGEFAEKLSMRVLARTWQMLSKGIQEVQGAQKPLQSAEMLLVRIAHAADLPTPDDALRLLKDGNGGAAAVRNGGAAPSSGASASMTPAPAPRLTASGTGGPRMSVVSQPAHAPMSQPVASAAQRQAPALIFRRFEDLVAFAGEQRDIQTKLALERDVRLVRFEPGLLEFSLAEGAQRSLAGDLGKKLQEWTGQRWMVAVSTEPGAPTIVEQREIERQETEIGVRADPLVQAILAKFPGAEIIKVQDAAPEPEAAPLESYADDDIGARPDEIGSEDPSLDDFSDEDL